MWRGVVAWHSPRCARLIDLWQNLQVFRAAATSSNSLLTGSAQLGVPNAYLLLLGTPFFRPGGAVGALSWLQASQLVWLAVAALLTGWLAARLIGRNGAWIAVAVFLFAPFVMMIPFSPAPIGLFLAFVAALGALSLAAYRGSPAALVGLGALAGFCLWVPSTAHWVLAACALAAWGVWRSRPPVPVVAAALVCFAASALPGLPDLKTIAEMLNRYVQTHGQWIGLEQLLLAQRPAESAEAVQALWTTGYRGPLDVALGALLSPFAVPRTPLRMLADCFTDPFGACLAAFGIAVCLRQARRSGTARLLLAILFLGVLPGALTSAYDRASLTRNLGAPMAVALLAALGAESVRPRLATARAIGRRLHRRRRRPGRRGRHARVRPRHAARRRLLRPGDPGPGGGTGAGRRAASFFSRTPIRGWSGCTSSASPRSCRGRRSRPAPTRARTACGCRRGRRVPPPRCSSGARSWRAIPA